MLRFSWRSGFLCLALVFAVSHIHAQTVTGTLSGNVTDASQGALPGVTVTIRNMDTGFERVVVTNEVGYFSAPFIPLGRYSVTAELSGFGTMRRENVLATPLS